MPYMLHKMSLILRTSVMSVPSYPWRCLLGIEPSSSYRMEKAMAPHSSTLAWKTPWTEEPGGLQPMGSRRVGHDWAFQSWAFQVRLPFHFSLSCNGEGNGNPLQCSCLENPRDGGAWWAAVYGVAQSWTRLKQLSSSSIKLLKEFQKG